MKILVTGGAGFIGSYIVDNLIEKNHSVVVYDNLDPQVHTSKKLPDYFNKKAKFILGDVRDKEKLYDAMKDVDIIFHKAAAVGVGQSMYQVEHYVDVNTRGTATLLDLIVNKKNKVKKLIVAASMSSYGEGLYYCKKCDKKIFPKLRTEKQLKSQNFELICEDCGEMLKPLPTDEEKRRDCNSIYAITKKDQEDMCLNIANAYDIPMVALRYFNVYGPRQSVSNPYTGVTAIFASRLLNNNQPIIYEDGLQTRDFINVKDIARANIMAMENDDANFNYFNVGSNNPIPIKNIALTLAKILGKDIKPLLVNKYRKGDVRHCFADISKIKKILGFEPKINFEEGMQELCGWLKTQNSEDKVDVAQDELIKKGLIL